MVAVEASAAALAMAKRNAAKHSLGIDFRHGRWLEPLGTGRFDLIVSNPPYVAAEDPHLCRPSLRARSRARRRPRWPRRHQR